MATQRGYYREELERAVNNIEMALTHLARCIVAYKDAHPEVASNLATVGDGLETAGKIIQAIHDQI